MNQRITISFVIAILAGCSISAENSYHTYADPSEYELRIEENVLLQRFDIVLISKIKRYLCMYSGDWPNVNGHLDFASNWVFVEVSGQKYPIKDHNMGFSIGATYVKIPPEGSIKSFIPFTEFDKKAFANTDTKRILHYKAKPFYCRR